MLKGINNITKKIIVAVLVTASVLSSASSAFAGEVFYWYGSAESKAEETEYETELAESLIEDLTLTSNNDEPSQEESANEEALYQDNAVLEQEDQTSEGSNNEVVYGENALLTI